MKNHPARLLFLLIALLAACTPDAVPTPPPTNDTTNEAQPETAAAAVPPPTTTPEAAPIATATAVPEAAEALPAAPGSPLMLVDQVGGAAMTVAVSGEMAFVGEGVRVTAVSLTDPAHPQVVGRSAPLGGVVRLLELYRDAAYVVAETGWIDVLDVSNPADMQPSARLALVGVAQSMAIADNFLYVTAVTGRDETTLSTWDIGEMATAVTSTSLSTSPAASLTLPTDAQTRLTSTGQLLFVSQSGRIDLFDITQPGQPQAVGALEDFEGFAVQPALPLADGRLLYANEFFHMFTIENPAAAGRMGYADYSNFQVTDSTARQGGFMTMRAETAVLIDTGTIAAPAGPSFIWTIDTTPIGKFPERVAELPFTANDVAFIDALAVAAHERGLSLIDLTDTAAPVLLGELAWGTAVSPSEPLAGFTTGSAVPSEVFTFDLSDPLARELFLSLQRYNIGSAVLGDVQVVADPAAGYPGAGLVQLDVTNPTAPVETAVIDPKINTLWQNGEWLFGTGSGLHTFALNTAGVLESVAVCEDCYDGGISAILGVAPGVLHLLGQNGVYIVTAADPTSLAPANFIPADFWITDGTVLPGHNTAYYLGTPCSAGALTCAGSTLWTLATDNALAPEIVNEQAVSGDARQLLLFGDMLWVVTTDGRLHPYDLTNPLAPQPLDQAMPLPLAMSVVQTAVSADTLYIFHPEMGLLAYQLARR
ncbi:MAG: hypothetical protein IPM53_17020 [Anaerolineaceae bacterium]|nr:hypothetical protein [Anaerolineaceae bacterium]